MESTNKNKVTEEEIIRAIRQVGEDSEIMEAFKAVSEQEFKTIVERERYKKHKAPSVKLWLYPAVSVAAVLLVLLMLNVFKTNSYQNLYAAYFEMPESTISRGSSTFSDLYDKELYKEALASVDEEDIENAVLLKFYVSVCSMKMEDFPKAIQNLTELHKAYPDWQEVQWYLALCYLKEKQPAKAKELFQKIDDEEYIDKAKDILGKLK